MFVGADPCGRPFGGGESQLQRAVLTAVGAGARLDPAVRPLALADKSDLRRAMLESDATARREPMPKRRNSPDVARRNFLKGASLVGAAALTPVAATAQVAAPKPDLKALPPGPRQVAIETQPPAKDPVTQTSAGGDFMVDVLKTLDFDYCVINCASSYRGIHESLINYGKNIKPELLTCPHE